MAFLCSGYWALLFCFASVQIGARGAALMQTTAESAKLRMEQIAELAKKSTVHKSKQQLEKITEDVKSLASQALIARSKSGNITAGGITDPLTKDALNIMKGSALGIVDQAESETDTLRALLSAAENDALACNVQVPALDTSYETNHDTCRTELSNLYPQYALAKNTYASAVNAIRDTSGCVTKFVSDCSAWDAEFFALANYTALRTCLVQIAAWSSDGRDDVLSKFGPYSAFVGKQPECDGLQQQYEHAFCVHRLSKVTQCQENHRCYESNKATYDQQAALVVSTNDARRAAYAAGKKIECLVDKLLTDLSETAIASCENAQVDTSSLEIQTQTLPTDPYSCPLTLEEVDAPCTPAWVSAYEAKDWYDGTLYTEYPLQCMSSCSVNPQPSLWMEAKGLNNDGSFWISTFIPGQTVYSFRAGDGSGDAQEVQDDGSCRSVVEFGGHRGFETPQYTPNIKDYLELWVVSDGDVVAGKDKAFILDSGSFPLRGLGFMYYNNNRVAAYASGQEVVADRPAAAGSGLTVWRVQWKSSSYIAISFNNKLLVNQTVSVNLTVNYSWPFGEDPPMITLGTQSKDADYFLQGHIAELQLFERELTDYEANMTNLGFMTKWAVNGTKGGICP